MDAYESNRLLHSSSSNMWSSQSRRSGSMWWALSALLAGFGTLLIMDFVNPVGSAHQATELRSVATVRSPVAASDVILSGVRATPNQLPAEVAYNVPSSSADPSAASTTPSFLFDSASSSFPALAGSGLLALAGLIAGVAHHLGRRSQVAMAPLIGMTTAPIDKGANPDGGSDQRAEQHRIDQRVVFNAERWRKHRGGSRFARALTSMPQSYVIQHIVNPVIALTVFSVAVCAAQLTFGTEVFNLPTSLFSLSAPSLGLLLVFRTNASYERWDGARKMIGLVKNRSEDLTRQMCVRFPANRPELKEQMLRYIQAFFFSLKVHLRGGPGGFEDDSNLIEDLTPILKPEELELLLQAPNRPAHIMHCMTQIVKAAKLDGPALFCLDQNLTTFADVLGGCERILRTPIPLSYTRMTTRFLFVWLLLLPFALSAEVMKLDHSIWLTVPSVSFISFALLGIEEVAVQIEEPFSILPMEMYAEGSRKNIAGVYGQMKAVAEMIKE